MKKFLKHIWIFNPISEIFNIIFDINEATDTHLISRRGYEILNNPVLKEEAFLQIEHWKRNGGSGICIINLDNKLYDKNLLIEKV